jgi:hypothetical protein
MRRLSMNKMFTVLTLLALGATAIQARQQNVHASAPMPVGGVIGERIPDSVAYRVYFIHVSQLDEAQAAQIARVSLSAEDATLLVAALDSFREKYTALSDAYNSEAIIAERNRKLPDFLAFHRAVNRLSAETSTKLLTGLSSYGVERFITFLRSEKQQMTVSESEVQ